MSGGLFPGSARVGALDIETLHQKQGSGARGENETENQHKSYSYTLYVAVQHKRSSCMIGKCE
jgi:hypothetical protein